MRRIALLFLAGFLLAAVSGETEVDAAEGESGAEHDPEAVVDPDELPFTWSGYGSYGEDDWSYDMEWSYEYCSLPHPFSRGRSLPALHSPSTIPAHPTHL